MLNCGSCRVHVFKWVLEHYTHTQTYIHVCVCVCVCISTSIAMWWFCVHWLWWSTYAIAAAIIRYIEFQYIEYSLRFAHGVRVCECVCRRKREREREWAEIYVCSIPFRTIQSVHMCCSSAFSWVRLWPPRHIMPANGKNDENQTYSKLPPLSADYFIILLTSCTCTCSIFPVLRIPSLTLCFGVNFFRWSGLISIFCSWCLSCSVCSPVLSRSSTVLIFFPCVRRIWNPANLI